MGFRLGPKSIQDGWKIWNEILVEKDCGSDGHCQFLCFSKALSPVVKTDVALLRTCAAAAILEWPKDQQRLLEADYEQSASEVANKIANTRLWGDLFTLLALCQEFKVNALVYQEGKLLPPIMGGAEYHPMYRVPVFLILRFTGNHYTLLGRPLPSDKVQTLFSKWELSKFGIYSYSRLIRSGRGLEDQAAVAGEDDPVRVEAHDLQGGVQPDVTGGDLDVGGGTRRSGIGGAQGLSRVEVDL